MNENMTHITGVVPHVYVTCVYSSTDVTSNATGYVDFMNVILIIQRSVRADFDSHQIITDHVKFTQTSPVIYTHVVSHSSHSKHTSCVHHL